MDWNIENEEKHMFGEIHDSPTHGKPALEFACFPSFFNYGREDHKVDSVVMNNRYLASPQQKGVSLQKIEDDGSAGGIECRTPVSDVINDEENVVSYPNQNHSLPEIGLLLPQLKSATKNLDKAVTAESENVNHQTDSDKGAMQENVSPRRSKKRSIDSTTSELPNKKVSSGTLVKQTSDEIDIPDVNNQLVVVKYIQDLYTFYRQQQHIHRPIDYMEKQLDLGEKTRAVAICWLVKVHHQCALRPVTLYLTVHIIDRYLSLELTPKHVLPLVIICALLIASKYEENLPLGIDELREITGNKYSREVIIRMENIILERLDWYLTVPTVYVFLVQFIKAAKADKELEQMIYYFGEVGLLEYQTIRYPPCMVAAAAVYTAKCTLGKYPLWTDTLKQHTTYSEDEIQEYARILAKALLVAARCNKEKLKVVFRKYQRKQYGGVALHPPAMTLIEEPKPSVPAAA